MVGDLEQSALADLEFHRALAELTKNALFLVMLDALCDILLDLRREAMSLPGNLEKGIEAHSRILAAVAARDPRLARHEMVEHFAISSREFFDRSPALGRSQPVGSASPVRAESK